VIKIKRDKVIMFLLILTTLIIISSCTKSECKTSSDCQSRVCALSKCENKKCAYTLQSNCCGNRINESIENGKAGNKCTCPQDYGRCEGKGKVRIGSRTQDAVYAHYYCDNDNKCVIGVESKDVTPQNFLDTINLGFFKASSVVKYNKPFDMGKEAFEFKITLDDTNKDIVLPVKMTGIRLLFSSEYSRAELLIAEKDLENEIDGVGKSAAITLPLNLDYRPQELEEIGSVRYSIDFTYVRKVASGKAADGTTLYSEELARDKYTSPSKQVFFVRSG